MVPLWGRNRRKLGRLLFCAYFGRYGMKEIGYLKMQNSQFKQSNFPLCIFLDWAKVYLDDCSMTMKVFCRLVEFQGKRCYFCCLLYTLCTLLGGPFTQSRGVNNQSLSRLNRFLVNEWDCHFSGSRQCVLSRPVSDHFPILLDGGV